MHSNLMRCLSIAFNDIIIYKLNLPFEFSKQTKYFYCIIIVDS